MPWLDPALRIALDLMLVAVLSLIAYRDAKTSEIPDALNLALLVLGAVALIIVPEIGFHDRLIGLVAVSGPMLLMSIMRRGSLGGGDIKLMGAAGFLLGWQSIVLAAALGILIAGVYAIYLVFVKKAKLDDKFPFGPMLCIGIALAYFFGSYIIVWLF
ncbi:MAG: A24 family peptidase [Coriobacteriales bacterium]|jgi:leader peptidase (prepilin peptidase)/N-methyltransferase|nr:A24 family peptidase [Coriobacteriales bacterium]